MEKSLEEQWLQLRQDHPSPTRPDLIQAHFQKRLDLLLKFQSAGIGQISREPMSVGESIKETKEILGIMGPLKPEE